MINPLPPYVQPDTLPGSSRARSNWPTTAETPTARRQLEEALADRAAQRERLGAP